VINIQEYKKRHNELSFILVDNPDQTHIPLKTPSVPILRINYIHNVVLEVRYFIPFMSTYISWYIKSCCTYIHSIPVRRPGKYYRYSRILIT